MQSQMQFAYDLFNLWLYEHYIISSLPTLWFGFNFIKLEHDFWDDVWHESYENWNTSCSLCRASSWDFLFLVLKWCLLMFVSNVHNIIWDDISNIIQIMLPCVKAKSELFHPTVAEWKRDTNQRFPKYIMTEFY